MYTPISFAFLAAVAASTVSVQPSQIDPGLIPAFGLAAGQRPDGNGNCAGSDDTKIPCFCPPNREEFVDKLNSAVASGHFLGTPVTFNVDPNAQSDVDKLDRATTCLIVLQSFNGTRGVGCPAVSAPNILDQQIRFVRPVE